MEKVRRTFHFIMDTVSADHPLEPLLASLKPHGILVLVGKIYFLVAIVTNCKGAPPKPFSFPAFGVLHGNKIIAGSGIGGIKETQEMLDYSAEHGIVSDVEVITVDRVEEAYERTEKADVKYRFVIDASSIKK